MTAKGAIAVGILYIFLSGLLCLFAAALATLQNVSVGQAIANSGFVPWMQYLRIVVGFAVGVTAILFGVAFRRRKRWSRRALQYLAGVLAAIYLIGSLQSVYILLSHGYHRQPEWFYAVSVIAGSCWAVGLALYSWFLNQAKVKAYVGESTQATA